MRAFCRHTAKRYIFKMREKIITIVAVVLVLCGLGYGLYKFWPTEADKKLASAAAGASERGLTVVESKYVDSKAACVALVNERVLGEQKKDPEIKVVDVGAMMKEKWPDTPKEMDAFVLFKANVELSNVSCMPAADGKFAYMYALKDEQE